MLMFSKTDPDFKATLVKSGGKKLECFHDKADQMLMVLVPLCEKSEMLILVEQDVREKTK